jgi:hypothetical protein
MTLRLRWPTQYPLIRQPFGVNWTGDPDFYARAGLSGHEGLDIEAPEGSEVYACADGVVSRISLDGDSSPDEKPYGNQIRITHAVEGGDVEYTTTYGHLQRVRDGLHIGSRVLAGELIAYAGSTGSSHGGAHLHLMLKKRGASAAGETPFPKDIVDPTPFLEPLVFSAQFATGGDRSGTPAPAPAPRKLGPPPLPKAFNGRYRLQANEAQFRARWGWVSLVDGKRCLNVIATPNAPYSSPQQRKDARSTLLVENAIRYLNPKNEPNGTPRYWPIPGRSYFCNIFVGDVTRLLHCEVPNNPAMTTVGQVLNWLQTSGPAAGWRRAKDGKEAQDWANTGRAAVMLWQQGKTSDHSALVRPGKGFVDSKGFFWPRVAQAGAVVTDDGDSYVTFRGSSDKPRDRIFWFLHD